MKTMADAAVRGLDVRMRADIVRVRDGADTWLCYRAAWDAALAPLATQDADEEDENGAEAYSALCRAVAAPVASINGTSRGDVASLVRAAYAAQLIDQGDAWAYGVVVGSTDGISVGDWVVAGRGEDIDVGRIVSLACGKETMGEGDAIGGDVAWEWSQTRTYSPIGGQNDVEVYGTREVAIEEAKRRKVQS